MGDRAQTYNVVELIRKLGFKSIRELPVIGSIQPALIVGEASGITSPLLAPTAWAGGQNIGAAGPTYPGLRVTSLGAGGCFVRHARCSSSGTGYLMWEINETERLVDVLNVPCDLQQMAPDLVASQVALITTSTAFATDVPQSRFVANTGVAIPDLVFIPRGWCLEMLFSATGTAAFWDVCIQDVIAPNLLPTG